MEAPKAVAMPAQEHPQGVAVKGTYVPNNYILTGTEQSPIKIDMLPIGFWQMIGIKSYAPFQMSQYQAAGSLVG